jgi:CheY-like chemotaxis protein
MPKPILVAVVEDDRFFRESMRRLMRSWGYRVEAFPSAANFLASSQRNRLLDRGRSDACNDRTRALPISHRFRLGDSHDPPDGLRQ